MEKEDNYKLDLKDRKILSELDSDCRQPFSRIAKKVGLSTEVVNYRIKKLEEENIITQYQIVVDLSKLKILQFKILLSFQHINSEKLEKTIKELKVNKSVKWIVSCEGSWDLIISAEVKSLEEMESLKNKILSLFESYINKKSLSIAVEAEVYRRKYLLDSKEVSSKIRIILSGNKESKLDELDLKILKQLSENARTPIIDIATELKISERIVNYRVKQLIKKEIITGFRIAINYEKLGIHFYKTFIYLDNPQEVKLNFLMNYLRNNKNIIHNMKVVGNWDLEPEFEVYSEKEFNQILNEIKDKFADIIKNIEVVLISKEYKSVYF